MFDFGAFQEKIHMPSRAKYILHILFGAFQETLRILPAQFVEGYLDDLKIVSAIFRIEAHCLSILDAYM